MGLKVVVPGTSPDGKGVPIVDIVAVHGLNPLNKPDRGTLTWQKEGQDGTACFWLQDEVPKAIPNARILVYEYDSNPAFGKGRERFVHQATDLLERVQIEREHDPMRGLVFIGHSLGGILIKQALVNAQNNREYENIKQSTTGLMFFGTPHGGGNETLVSFGNVCAKIVKAAIHQGVHGLTEH